MSPEYYIYYLYYTFLGYPFIIRLAVIAIIIYTPFFLYVLYKLIHTRNSYYRKKRIRQNLQKKYGNHIQTMISSEKTYHKHEIGKILNADLKKISNTRKKILTNIILNSGSRNTIINKENYRNLVEYLQLREFWEKRLKYGSIQSRQQALRKLDDLDIEIPGSVITSLTYNRNQYLRKRARSSYMYFSKNNPYKFFDEDFDKTFNDWDKVEIHRMLSRRVNERLPNLSQWIRNSRNNDFKCFLVEEIRHFRQYECCPYLLELIITIENLLLKKLCIETLGELGYIQAEDILINEYPLQPQTIQQSIVKAVCKLNTGKSLPFLKEAYHNASDIESRKIILYAIHGYGDAGRKLFDSLKTISQGFHKLLFEHVSNPLIKYI